MANDVVLTAEHLARRPPHAVFASFGEVGWLFGARCDAVRLGVAVSLRLPLEGVHRSSVDVLGRFARAVPGVLLDIVHTQPWRGRLGVRFVPVAEGTRVRVQAHVPVEGVHWLLPRRAVDEINADGGIGPSGHDRRRHRRSPGPPGGRAATAWSRI